MVYLYGRAPVYDKEFKSLARYASSDAADLFSANFEFDFARVVDENAISTVRHIERYALIGLIATSAAILVPNPDSGTYVKS